MTESREAVVIGGGLAGGAAALRLARAGRDVLLIERARAPHDKVCGEFLSFEAQDELAALGLDLRPLGAVPIRAVALARGPRRTEAALPFEGLSLSRRVLDAALLDLAAQAGAEVRRARATGLREGWTVETDAGEVSARHVLLATGKHDLRGWSRPAGPQGDLLGLKSYWRLPPGAPLDAVELHLFPGGYAGLQRVEPEAGGRTGGDGGCDGARDGGGEVHGRANLCLVVRGATFASLGHRWDALLAHILAASPSLAAILDSAEPCDPKPLAVSSIPYGLLQPRAEGVWRLGDQAAVIPSFTGEGMSIALLSARLAATALLAGEPPDAFQARLAASLRAQVARSTRASRALVAPAASALAARLATPALMRWVLRRTRIPAHARSGARA